METILTAIRAMILQIVDQKLFPANNIKGVYQSLTNQNFICYQLVNSNKTGITGINYYAEEEATNALLYENIIQVDFYSNSFFPANDAARLFNHYLTAKAPEYLPENYPGMTIGVVDDVADNTSVGDIGTYVKRYTCRFTMFTHEYLITTQDYIDTIIVTPEFLG